MFILYFLGDTAFLEYFTPFIAVTERTLYVFLPNGILHFSTSPIPCDVGGTLTSNQLILRYFNIFF